MYSDTTANTGAVCQVGCVRLGKRCLSAVSMLNIRPRRVREDPYCYCIYHLHAHITPLSTLSYTVPAAFGSGSLSAITHREQAASKCCVNTLQTCKMFPYRKSVKSGLMVENMTPGKWLQSVAEIFHFSLGKHVSLSTNAEKAKHFHSSQVNISAKFSRLYVKISGDSTLQNEKKETRG